MTCETRILSITVQQPLAVVAAYLADRLNFPAWASGLATGLAPMVGQPPGTAPGTWYTAQTSQGAVSVRFSPPNDLGVADHWVHLPDGAVVYVPLRVVANGSGAEVVLVLFRLPSMDTQRFEDDAAWVTRDLQKLKAVLETPARVPEENSPGGV
jgi:hypothetical protein